MGKRYDAFVSKMESRLADRMRKKLAMSREDYVKPERMPSRIRQLQAERAQSAAYKAETMQMGNLVRFFLGKGYTLPESLALAGRLADRYETHKLMES